MTSPAVRAEADRLIREELAVRLTASHDAVLRRVPDLYRKIIGEALAAEQGDTGKAAQLRVAQRALDRVARIGVVDFVDQSGRRWTMQSYVEMAVRTAAFRARTEAQLTVWRDRGLTLVYVTNVAGQCDLCRPWEGRVLAIDEVPADPIVTDGDGVDVEIAGTVAEAMAAGWGHPQCRHQLRPYRPGQTVIPPATPDPEAYAAQQQLRSLERQVRAWKRREAAAMTPEAKATAERKVAQWQAEIRRHVEETGVRRLRGREQVDAPLASPAPRARPDRPAVETVPVEPLRPLTPAELVADYQAKLPDLDPDERRALLGYTGGDFNLVNTWLRGNNLTPPSNPDSVFADLAAPQAEALSRLIARYELPTPAVANRWVFADAIPSNAQPGSAFTDRGFGSTTLNDERPAGIAGDVRMVIDVPAGMNAVVVNGTGRGVTDENELLLPAGTRYRVVSDEIRDGERWLNLTALPPA